MEITIRRGERQYGPYGEEQIRDMLRTGSVVPEDEASAGGPWVRLDSLLPPTSAPDRSHAPEIALGEADLVASGPRITLWNPNHVDLTAGLFCILAGGMFAIIGPIIHALNWRSLGRPEEATKSWLWAGGLLLVLVISCWVSEEFLSPEPSWVMFLALVVWHLAHGRSQARYVKSGAGGPVGFRSSKPLVFGSLAVAAAAVVLLVVPLLSNEKLENEAKRLINERLHDSMGAGALECVEVRLGDRIAKDLYQASALIDNGRSILLTVRRLEGDQISIRVDPASLEELFPGSWR